MFSFSRRALKAAHQNRSCRRSDKLRVSSHEEGKNDFIFRRFYILLFVFLRITTCIYFMPIKVSKFYVCRDLNECLHYTSILKT